jgi:hypothetical protein
MTSLSAASPSPPEEEHVYSFVHHPIVFAPLGATRSGISTSIARGTGAMLQGGPIRRGRPRTAALRLKSVRVFVSEASVRRGL